MVISIFKPPEEGKIWAEHKTGDICDCLSYEYEKYFNGVGTFTLELPVNTRFRAELLVNRILVTDSGDALIIKNILTTLDKIKVTGYDLNGLLCDRVTLGTASDGYDPHAGSTEACVKYYVRNNLAESEVAQRNLPRFEVVSSTLDRGVAADHAQPRYQNLQELVTEMCGAAKLGWRVYINPKGGSADTPVCLFDVAEQVDRSAGQSERDRVVFSVQTHNVSEMTREVGITSAKNVLYLDIDGTVVQYPQTAESDGTESGDGGESTAKRTPGAGYDRREEYCSLSCGSLNEEDYGIEAEQNIADRMEETDSLTIDAGSPLDYGVRYNVGDIVTVYDRDRSLQLDSVISAAKVTRSGGEYSVRLTLGDSKPKLLDQYAKKSEVTSGVVRDKSTVGTYTKKIAFKSGGFDLTFISAGTAAVNSFSVTEDSAGRIAKITNTTAGRSIDVTYD